jgi:hypothetical protein
MADTPSQPVAQTLSMLLNIQLGQTSNSIKACPENRRFHQVGPGKATPIWLVGHLANSANFLGMLIGLGQKSDFPKDWSPRFTPGMFGGLPITTNPGDYPAWDEVVEAYKRVMGNYVKAVGELKDAEIPGPCRGKVPPPLAGMLPDLQASICVNIVHDGHHRGQLALLANAPD